MDTCDIAELRSAIRRQVSGSRDMRACYRALCVLLIAEGQRPHEVADWLGEHTRTLERWRKRFVEQGLCGLKDETSPGRPPRLSDEQWRRLGHDLRRPPADFGLDGKTWQGKLLREHLDARYGVAFSLRQCQRLLKQHRQRPAGRDFRARNAPGYIPAGERARTE